jgi:hypothetical protein
MCVVTVVDVAERAADVRAALTLCFFFVPRTFALKKKTINDNLSVAQIEFEKSR